MRARSKRNDLLSTHQIRVLACLYETQSALPRKRIAEKLGMVNTVVVGRAIGYRDIEARTQCERSSIGGHRSSLLTLEFVEEIVVDIDGKKETLVQITEAGKAIYEELGSPTMQDLPPLNNRHAK